MSVGTLIFQRFNGVEEFTIRQADLFLLAGDEDHSPRLSFEFEADDTPLKTLPDTESLHASPGGEFTVDVSSLDVSGLAGQVFSVPHGDNDGEWLARIYYVEHDAAKNCTVRVLERDGNRFRVAVDGHCKDMNFYDGPQPDMRFVLEAWFTRHHR